MLTCRETVTLIKHVKTPSGDEYVPHAVAGASWHGGMSLAPVDNGEVSHFALSVRIPQQRMPVGVIPAAGDLVLRGPLPDGADCSSLASVLAIGAVRITAVRDNCRGSLPHWRLIASVGGQRLRA